MTADMMPRTTAPLTLWQQLRLLTDCVPALFFAMMFAAYVLVLADLTGGRKPALVLFLIVVMLVTGHRAFQRLRDVLSGEALVQDDLLERITGRGSQRHRRWHHHGHFAKLGRLIFTRKAYYLAKAGLPHRVTYSPASRIVWSVEPLA